MGLDVGDLRPDGTLCTCSQESSTGGGIGVLMVLVLMSPMMLRASFRAWYMRSISSRRWACSADSSISVFWSPHEYRFASSSEWMKSFVLFIMRCMIVFGMRSLMVLLTIAM